MVFLYNRVKDAIRMEENDNHGEIRVVISKSDHVAMNAIPDTTLDHESVEISEEREMESGNLHLIT